MAMHVNQRHNSGRVGPGRLAALIVLICAATCPAGGEMILKSSPHTYGYALSGDGAWLVGTYDGQPWRERTVAGPGYIPGLGDLPGWPDGGVAEAVSADGSVIGGKSIIDQYEVYGPFGDSYTVTITEAFIWTEADGIGGLGIWPGGGEGASSDVTDMSADGSVLVGLTDSPDGYRVFRWTEADGMQLMEPAADGAIMDRNPSVSADGTIIAGTGGGRVLRWTVAGGTQPVMNPDRSELTASRLLIAGNGLVLVGVHDNPDGGERLFRWTQTEGVTYPYPTTVENSGLFLGDVSSDGSVVVGYGYTPAAGTYEAIMWAPQGGCRLVAELLIDHGIDAYYDYQSLSNAYGVSDDGSVLLIHGRTRGGTYVALTLRDWNELPPVVARADKFAFARDADINGTEPITLDGTESEAYYGGLIVSYHWYRDGILIGTQASVTRTMPVGIHNVLLVVTDAIGNTSTAETICRVIGPGDFDGDGDRDLEDFVILKVNFGRTDAELTNGDCDNDGDVDVDDFVIFKNLFGL